MLPQTNERKLSNNERVRDDFSRFKLSDESSIRSLQVVDPNRGTVFADKPVKWPGRRWHT